MPPEVTNNTPLVTTAVKKDKKDMSWKTFLFYVCLVIIVRIFVIEPHSVSGSSMIETFHDNDYLFVEKLSYHFTSPQRGDVIVFNPPAKIGREGDRFIKRVIGIPGDTVEIAGGKTFLNGKELTENYVKYPSAQNAKAVLRDGEYFMMGDNRAGSYDSRSWGPITADEIQGRVLLRLYPFDQISLYPGDTK